MKSYLILLSIFSSLNLFAETDFESAETIGGEDEVVSGLQSYPIEAIDRPSILPIGMFEFLLRAGSTATLKPTNLKLGVSAGLTTRYQLGLSYDGIDVYEFNVKEVVTMRNRIKIGTWAPFSTNFELDVPFHIASGEILRTITLGAPLTFFNEIMAGGFLNDGLLTIYMRPEAGVALNFNAWYGVQAGKHFWGELGLNLATLDYQKREGQALHEWQIDHYWSKPNVSLLLLWAWTNWFDTAIILNSGDFRNFVDTFSYSLNFIFRGSVF